MKKFVPSEVCLGCEGCCRFPTADSDWRPYITPTERSSMVSYCQEKKIPPPTRAPGNLLLSRSCHGIHHCQYHNPQDNTCGVYLVRPWECQIYPFVLVRHNGEAKVGMHLHCPYAREHQSDTLSRDYVTYLKEEYFAQESILNFLRQNPGLVRDYSAYDHEMVYLFSLPIPVEDAVS